MKSLSVISIVTGTLLLSMNVSAKSELENDLRFAPAASEPEEVIVRIKVSEIPYLPLDEEDINELESTELETGDDEGEVF